MVRVELIFIDQDNSTISHKLDLNAGATVADAIEQSGIYRSHPHTQNLPLGIFAKPVALDCLLKDGDRVEIYRLLARDPKEKRRQQASLIKKEANKKSKKR